MINLNLIDMNDNDTDKMIMNVHTVHRQSNNIFNLILALKRSSDKNLCVFVYFVVEKKTEHLWNFI